MEHPHSLPLAHEMQRFHDYSEFGSFSSCCFSALPASRLKPLFSKCSDGPLLLKEKGIESKAPIVTPKPKWLDIQLFFLFLDLFQIINPIFMVLNKGAHCYPFSWLSLDLLSCETETFKGHGKVLSYGCFFDAVIRVFGNKHPGLMR